MISVAQAQAALFDLVSPLASETVGLAQAHGRVLAAPATALRDQPPFAASSMDGYAVSGTEVSTGASWTVIGEAAAGHRFDGTVKAGQAVRIFTGAPLPPGCDHVVIQENIAVDDTTITLTDGPNTNPYMRPAGADFKVSQTLEGPRVLGPTDIALLASMNVAQVQVTRRPVVAIIPTGDELVQPGEVPSADQIVASNSFGLAAMLDQAGAKVRMMPIARDRTTSLSLILDLAADADLIVAIGGASVGDHDLVESTAAAMGLTRSFYKVAMRPGKPLMAGRLGSAAMVGLPGNPVSAMVCGTVFLLPMIQAMLGFEKSPAPRLQAQLTHDIPTNGPREHYMRATVQNGDITLADRQDSALLSVLNTANALAIRPPNQPAMAQGDNLDFLPI